MDSRGEYQEPLEDVDSRGGYQESPEEVDSGEDIRSHWRRWTLERISRVTGGGRLWRRISTVTGDMDSG